MICRNQNDEDLGNANEEGNAPLLRNGGDEDRDETRNILCFRNVNREVIGLIIITLVVALIIGILYLISIS